VLTARFVFSFRVRFGVRSSEFAVRGSGFEGRGGATRPEKIERRHGKVTSTSSVQNFTLTVTKVEYNGALDQTLFI
jgi:hypothetical protein